MKNVNNFVNINCTFEILAVSDLLNYFRKYFKVLSINKKTKEKE